MVTLDVKLQGFDRMVLGIAAAAKKPLKEVITMESGAILQSILDRTKIKATAAIRAAKMRSFNDYAGGLIKSRARAVEPRISIAPKTRNDWWVDRNGEGKRTFYIMNGNRKWSDSRWSQYRSEENDRQADLKHAVAEAVRRRGLPKQSWFFLGELIGAKMRAAGYVVNAAVNGNELRSVAIALVNDLGSEFAINFKNTSRVSYYADGTRLLNAAIRGRVKYFETNLRLGVLKEMQKVARAYPGLKIS